MWQRSTCRATRSSIAASSAAVRPSRRTAAGASAHNATRPVCKVFESVESTLLPCGFADPDARLPSALEAYEDALLELPKLALGSPGCLRRALLDLPPFDLQQLPALGERERLGELPPAGGCYGDRRRQQPGGRGDGAAGWSCDAQLWRGYMVLSFLSHAYMWCGGPDIPQVLPAPLAGPWARVAAAAGMPPVLVYATYNLLNWRRLDPQGPLQLGNLACQASFLGGCDEDWFRLVHVAIEAAGAPAVSALPSLARAAQQRDAPAMEVALAAVAQCLRAVQELLGRMGEHCDPYVYYRRVRLPMGGWRNNPALPHGLVYEGLWGGEPQHLYGETGAQSALVPALDAALGIQHEQGWLLHYLHDMRAHMPPSHRAFLARLEAGPSVRAAVCELAGIPAATAAAAAGEGGAGPLGGGGGGAVGGGGGGAGAPPARRGASLVEAYDAAVMELERFRAQHRSFAQAYIAQWSKKEAKEVGTGGSDFMPALTGYRKSTAGHRLASRAAAE